MTDRAARIQSALQAYAKTSWGQAVTDPDQAEGLCKRASLVLLELLNREGIEDAELWHLGVPKVGSGFAPTDEHYVVAIGTEAIDATARQFDPTSEPITRSSLDDVKAPWCVAQRVETDSVDSLFRGEHPHGIPTNWRELADVDPPGDAIGWPYPGGWPTRPTDS